MLKRYPVLSVIVFLFAMTALAVFTQADSRLGGLAAQDATPIATATETAKPTVVATPAPDGNSSKDDSSWWTWPAEVKFEFWVVLAVLTIVGFVIGLAVRRFDRSEARYIELHKEYLKRGLSVSISQDSTLFEHTSLFKSDVDTPAIPKYKAKITGPAELVLNKEGTYSVVISSTDDGTTVDPANLKITWSLKDDGHGWTKPAGATVRVLPAVVGTVTLIATVEGADGQATFDINVIAEAKKDVATLPNPTAGWGTLVTSVLILGFAVVVGTLAHEFTAVLTLFGTIAGYAYGRSKPDPE